MISGYVANTWSFREGFKICKETWLNRTEKFCQTHGPLQLSA